jgi:hypothetical protein
MNHSTSTLLIPLASLALACTEPRSTDIPGSDDPTTQGSLPTAIRPEPPAIAADQAVLIRQLGIGNPTSWRLEQGGSRIAAPLGRECGVWQLDSGDFLGAADSQEPCETWAPLQPIPLVDGISGLALAHPDGTRQLALSGDGFELSGGKPISGRLRGDHRYRAAAFSPDGARLALFVAGTPAPLQIQVWDLDSGRLERELAFAGHDEAKAEGFALRWDAASLTAVVRFTPPPCDPVAEPGCDEWFQPGWSDAHVVQTWSAIEGEPQRIVMAAYPGEERVEQIFADPEQRWLFTLIEVMEPRDGTGFSFREIPLDEENPSATGLHWWSETLEGERAPLDTGAIKQWSSTVGSSFVDVQTYAPGYGYGYGSWTSVMWSMTSLTSQSIPDAPIELLRTQGVLIEGEVGTHAWRIGLAGRGVLLGEIDQCPTPYALEEAKAEGLPPPPCEQTRIAPEGCTAIDASWAFDRVLLACQDRWWLAPTPESHASADLGLAVELARGTGDPRQVVWGPEGLAIWTFSEGLRLFEGDRLAATHATVTDLHRAVLDEELDLALVREREGVRVVDLASAELGPTLAWTERVEFAAFAPDRSQIAIAGEGELAVFLRGESQPVARWRTGKLAGMAFRQDGEVLYVGATRPLPELALDPASGAQVESAQLDRVAFERIAAAELDPSWRWAIEEDGTILRTIDGQAIELTGENGAISESGWFSDDPAYLGGYRVRIGPSSPAPVYELDAVADQLTRPNLITEFFAGTPLPRPTLKPPQPPPPIDTPAGSR